MPILSVLFSYRGRIGRPRYFLLVLIAIVCAVGAFFGAAMASDPKGTDGPLVFAFPFLIAFLWIFTAAVTRRLRDAGWPIWMRVAYAVSPVALFFVAASAPNLELVVALGAAALILTPALAGPSKNTVQAEP